MSGTTGPGSAGTLPNGMSYGNGLNNAGADGIILGGGELYMMATSNLTSIPDDSTIEVTANNMGIITSGFKITSKPKLEAVYNQYEQLVSNFVIREEFSVKTGIVTWNLNNFQTMSTATTYSTSTDTRAVWTGETNQLPCVLVRFTKTNADGSVIRFTMVGQGGKGFGLEFGSKPVTFDAELEAIAFFKNFMAEIRVTAPAGQTTPTPTETAVVTPELQENKVQA